MRDLLKQHNMDIFKGVSQETPVTQFKMENTELPASDNNDWVGKLFKNYSQAQILEDFKQFGICGEELSLYERTGIGSLDEWKEKFRSNNLPNVPLQFPEYAKYLSKQLGGAFVDVSSPKFIGHMTSKLPNFHLPMSLLVNLLNQNMVKVETSGSISLLERQMITMLHRVFFGSASSGWSERKESEQVLGLVNSGGSVSNVLCLHLAKIKALMKSGVTLNEIKRCGANKILLKKGFDNAVVICPSSMHYSFHKAAALMGWGQEDVMVFDSSKPLPQQQRQIENIIQRCELNNSMVVALVGVAGATETGRIDNLNMLSNIAENYGIHFHVDAAWGGVLQFSDKYRHLIEGIDSADTITFCPHKQLYLPQGISICLFKNSSDAELVSINAAYQARKGSFDMGQYTIEGSRPALCLHLHAAFHLMGKKGIADLVDKNIERAFEFAELISLQDDFDLCWEPQMNIVNYRYIPERFRTSQECIRPEEDLNELNKLTQFISQKQFSQGSSFVSVTSKKIPETGESMHYFRAVLCNPLTSKDDLLCVLAEQRSIAEEYYKLNQYESCCVP